MSCPERVAVSTSKPSRFNCAANAALCGSVAMTTSGSPTVSPVARKSATVEARNSSLS
jgi:hypothetical protein